jgi:hypothetical protein
LATAICLLLPRIALCADDFSIKDSWETLINIPYLGLLFVWAPVVVISLAAAFLAITLYWRMTD